MTRRELHSERGSALLITMVVITIVGSIAFAIGASTVASLRQQTQMEDSLNAYAAATAGLEDGLLRWRFSKDTETPRARSGALSEAQSGDLTCSVASHPTAKSLAYDRVNLTTGTVTFCINPDDEPTPDPSHIVYDLKMYHRLPAGTPETVETTPSPNGDIPALQQDAAVEYDVAPITAAQGDVAIQVTPASGLPAARDFLEFIGLGADGAVVQRIPLSQTQLLGRQVDPLRLGLKPQVQRLRMKYYGQDVRSYTLTPSPSETALDGRLSYIEATGYFGRAKRKLRLTLDRASGTVFPVFDFALFSQTSGISPQ